MGIANVDCRRRRCPATVGHLTEGDEQVAGRGAQGVAVRYSSRAGIDIDIPYPVRERSPATGRATGPG